MIDRTQYGYPIEIRAEKAREYAAAVKDRNKPGCNCERCKQEDMLPAIQRILARFGRSY